MARYLFFLSGYSLENSVAASTEDIRTYVYGATYDSWNVNVLFPALTRASISSTFVA